MKEKKDKQVFLDMQTAKKLMQRNPMKVYTIRLEDGWIVDIRLHPSDMPTQKGKTEEFKPAKEGFKQAWKEAMRGETLPLSELWTK